MYRQGKAVRDVNINSASLALEWPSISSRELLSRLTSPNECGILILKIVKLLPRAASIYLALLGDCAAPATFTSRPLILERYNNTPISFLWRGVRDRVGSNRFVLDRALLINFHQRQPDVYPNQKTLSFLT